MAVARKRQTTVRSLAVSVERARHRCKRATPPLQIATPVPCTRSGGRGMKSAPTNADSGATKREHRSWRLIAEIFSCLLSATNPALGSSDQPRLCEAPGVEVGD